MTEKLPDTIREPDDREWMSDLDSFIVEVRRHDKHDVLVGTQHFMLVEDTDTNSFIVTSILKPAEPEL